MKKIFYFIPAIVLMFPMAAFAQTAQNTCFFASGFGTSGVNGFYYYLDSNGGSGQGDMPDRFSNANGFYVYTASAAYEILISNTLGATDGLIYYYYPASHPFDYTAISEATPSDWVVYDLGTSPAGSFAETPCAAPPPPAPVIPAVNFSMPSSTPSALMAMITSQVNDLGTFGYLVLIVAIPLFFYIVRELLEIMPRRGRKP